MRRRDAQAACPDLEVLAREELAEARAWEAAAAAVEAFAPGVEVLAPGLLALGSRGPSRYFGGEANLAAKVMGSVEEAARAALAPSLVEWKGFCQVGLADGLFAAGVAARLAGQQSPSGPVVVPVGRSAEFLQPLPLALLVAGDRPGARPYGARLDGAPHGARLLGARSHGTDPPSTYLPGTGGADFTDLVDLLGRLGVKTFGDLAALPIASVVARFGTLGQLAHELARGHGGTGVRARRPPPDWAVAAELDPPVEDLSAGIFVAKALAEQLYDRLSGAGLSCSRLAIEVRTETSGRFEGPHGRRLQPGGAVLRRSWRCDGPLNAEGIAERVRWQLESWRLGKPGRVTWLCLAPEEVHSATGHQLGIWGPEAGAADKARRAVAKLQSMLGPEAVVTGVLQGGRDYEEQVRLVPWGEPRAPLRPGGTSIEGRAPRAPYKARPAATKANATKAKEGPPPWPGRLPGIAPALVHLPPRGAEVLGEDGRPVTVGSRGEMSSPPAWVKVGEGPGEVVEAWAGPWPFEERWWDTGGRRRARLQVCTAGSHAYLLVRERRSWWVEATYD